MAIEQAREGSAYAVSFTKTNIQMGSHTANLYVIRNKLITANHDVTSLSTTAPQILKHEIIWPLLFDDSR